ncbi:MAG: YqaE/Pmp3 family membrane protein [Anaerolineales bacterium]
MGFGRAILCVILPPLAVIDQGCESILLVTALTLVGWVPGVIAAVLICTRRR